MIGKEDIEMSQTEQNITQEATEVTNPTGKVFSEDYVKTIREEAKENRLARKAAEQQYEAITLKVKELIGLKPEDQLKEEHFATYKQKMESEKAEMLTKANEKLLQAEIKILDGYDGKLVSRLLDRSKVTIADDGTITGLKEALTALEEEFPQIKKGTADSGANPPTTNVTEIEALEQKITEARKQGNSVAEIALINKIYELRHKK
jgi:hypothetical protein